MCVMLQVLATNMNLVFTMCVCYVTGASYGHVQALQAPGRFEDTPGDSEGGQWWNTTIGQVQWSIRGERAAIYIHVITFHFAFSVIPRALLSTQIYPTPPHTHTLKGPPMHDPLCWLEQPHQERRPGCQLVTQNNGRELPTGRWREIAGNSPEPSRR